LNNTWKKISITLSHKLHGKEMRVIHLIVVGITDWHLIFYATPGVWCLDIQFA